MSKKEGSRIEQVPIEKLRPHPKNYRQHPDDQLDHIVARILAFLDDLLTPDFDGELGIKWGVRSRS